MTFHFSHIGSKKPNFHLFNQNSPKGVDNLDPKLTINSTTKTPTFRYKGGDADATDWNYWGYGEDLNFTSDGTNPDYNEGSPLLGPNDDSVKFNAGDYYKASNASLGDLTFEDIVVEIVFKHSTTNSVNLFSKYNSTGYLLKETTDFLRFWIEDQYGGVGTNSAALTDGVWYHAMIFVDRSGYAQWYVNGVASGAAVDVSGSSDFIWAFTGYLTIGADSAGANNFDSNIAYVSMWSHFAWLDTHLQADIAEERFTRLTGFYPYIAEGTAIPTVYTRGSKGYLDKITIGSTDPLVDGDMEATDGSDWTAIYSASKSKETTDPHGGSRYLRITSGGSAWGAVRQSALDDNEFYKLTGWARGDGTISPSVWDDAYTRKVWEGTSDKGWQYFSVTVGLGQYLYLSTGNVTSGYVEFDDLEMVDITRNVYLVSDDWLRLVERIDDDGEVIHGYLAETSTTNNFLYSSNFDVVWSGINVSDTFGHGAVSSPNLEVSGNAILGSTDDTEHGVSQTATVTADTWCFSVFAQKGFEDYLYLSDYTVSNADCYFNLEVGEIGTEGAACTGYIEPWGDGWYRCGIIFTGTAAAHEFRIQPAEGDGDKVYIGNDDQSDMYIWGTQLENNSYMSSYFSTGGSAATRDKDELRYKGDDGNVTNNNENTIEYKMLIPDQTPLVRPVPLTISDGGSTSDRILSYTNGSDLVEAYAAATGGDTGYVLGTTDVSDGTFHKYKITCQKGYMHLFVDGVSEGIDTSVHVASGLDRIDVAQSQSATNQPNGIVTDIKLYDYVDKDYGPTFQLFKGTGPEGVDAISPYMTVNGITETPVFRYKGGDADGTDWNYWGYGQNLDLESGTVPSYNQGSPLLGPNDDSVKFNTGGHYQAGNSSFADVTTEDIVTEIIFKTDGAKNRILIDKEDTNPGYIGWRWMYQTGGEVSFRTYQASSVYTVSTALDSDCWYHAIVFINRDEGSTNGSQMYINGIASGTGVDHSANSASLTNSVNLTIGANTGGAFQGDCTIAYTTFWKSASWHKAGAAGPSEWADIAAKRFAQLSGIYPFKAKGTALPTVQTRASAAYLDKIVYDTDILVDGDMEGSDTSDWTSVNSSTLSKVTPGQFNRTQYLKIASSGTNWPSARQAVLTDGNYYKVTGYAKGDGNRSPSIWDDTLTRRIWIGTPSTEWQRFSAAFIARGTNIDFTAGATDTGYVGFDNVTLEPITKELYQVGDNWMRVVRRIDENSTEVKGYLSEDEKINRADYSEDFSNGRTIVACSISTDQTTAPNGETTADVLHEDDTSSPHYIYDTTGSSVTSGDDVVYSIFVKAINRDWVRLTFYDLGDAFSGHTSTWFDLSTGEIGTDENDESGIENWGNGWYRCWIKREADSTDTVSYIILTANANDNTTFLGLDQDSLYVWGEQVEFDVDYPSSYIPVPSTSDITRSPDQLRYKGDDGNVTNNQQGTISCDVLTPDYTVASNLRIVSISDGGATADRIVSHINGSFTRGSGGSNGDKSFVTDITDGVIKNLKTTYRSNDLNVLVDGSIEGVADTTVSIPNDLDRIDIGQDYTATNQPNGIVSNLRVYDYPKPDYKSTFSLFSEGNFVGVDALDPNLTINGITEHPILRYKGGDATKDDWNYWGYGENLDYQSGTSPTLNQGSPLLGPNDDSVLFNGGAYYQADNSSFADITTEDIVFEIVFKHSSSGTLVLLGKDTSGIGWFPFVTTALLFRLDDGPTLKEPSSAVLDDGVWYHAMCFLDKSGSAQWYVNGSASGSPLDISAVGTLTNAANLTFGARYGGTLQYDSNVAYVSMWKHDAWLDTHLQADVAAERFAKLTGIYPDCLGTAIPTVQTRATTAYLDKIEYNQNLLVDGNMEESGVGLWDNCSDSTLTKETDGAGGQVLRVTTTSGNTGSAQQRWFITVGVVYRVTGRVRSDGNSTPKVWIGNTLAWIGTTSTSWQEFDVTGECITWGILYLSQDDVSGVHYVEYDDVFVTPAAVSPSRKMYQVGDNWMRCVSREDSNGDSIKGYLAETAATNRADYSEDFSQSRSLLNASVVTNQTYAPNKELTADILHEDSTAGASHYVYDTTGSSVDQYSNVIYSTFVKAKQRNWVSLAFSSGSAAFDTTTYTYFDLSTGVVGDTDQNDASGIENWGDGWYRCWIKRAAENTGTVLYVLIIAEGDNDYTFDGQNKDSIHMWGDQVEFDVDHPSSYIYVSSTTDVARNKDQLQYKGDDGNVTNNQQGTISCDTLVTDHNLTTYPYLVTLSDGGVTNDRVGIYLYTTGDVASTLTRGSGGNDGSVTGATDVVDGQIYTIKATYRHNDLNLYVDGSAEGTPDTSMTVPDNIDRIDIGQAQSAVNQTNGIISNIQIFDTIEE